ncbi:hypothetical protein GCM10018966_028880 [Streptomyces yanii]
MLMQSMVLRPFRKGIGPRTESLWASHGSPVGCRPLRGDPGVEEGRARRPNSFDPTGRGRYNRRSARLPHRGTGSSPAAGGAPPTGRKPADSRTRTSVRNP